MHYLALWESQSFINSSYKSHVIMYLKVLRPLLPRPFGRVVKEANQKYNLPNLIHILPPYKCLKTMTITTKTCYFYTVENRKIYNIYMYTGKPVSRIAVKVCAFSAYSWYCLWLIYAYSNELYTYSIYIVATFDIWKTLKNHLF